MAEFSKQGPRASVQACSFDAESVRGALGVLIWREDSSGDALEDTAATGVGLLRSLGAVFPDDGCSPAFPLGLDERVYMLGETPRAAYERNRKLRDYAIT